jgi:hypothetical protein
MKSTLSKTKDDRETAHSLLILRRSAQPSLEGRSGGCVRPSRLASLAPQDEDVWEPVAQ